MTHPLTDILFGLAIGACLIAAVETIRSLTRHARRHR